MSYNKQTWRDEVSPLNAHRMNHMEQGIKEGSDDAASLNEKVAKIQQLAPVYDAAVSYFPGNIVKHNDSFYRCIYAATGEWDPINWELLTFNYFQSSLDEKVDKSTSINGYHLDADVNLTKEDVGVGTITNNEIDAMF